MPEKIVVIDDDPGTIYLIGRILHGMSDLSFATSGEKALQVIHDAVPDLILLDAELPGMSGFKVFDVLKSEPELANIPVIFITAHNEAGFEVSALNMGAADFIAKPFAAALLLARVTTCLRGKREADDLRRNASNDTLTGTASRHQFDLALQREWLRGLRVGDPMTLLLVELDHFDAYVERYGHPKADLCLRRTAAAIASVVRRPADVVARCGGEQFGVILPQTSRGGAEVVAQRILSVIESLRIKHERSLTAHHITASIGLSCYDAQSNCWEGPPTNFRFGEDLQKNRVASNLLLAADKALYSAKLAGHARARMLDIAEIDAPFLVRDVAPIDRQERQATWA